MSEQTYEPQYICWHEREFAADVVVRRMTPHQRLMYRSLLQSAYYCSTRPNLPDDDEQLCDLADADSVEMWQGNKKAVMRKFTLKDGLWSHKRLLADWEQLLAAHERAVENGSKPKRKRATGSDSLAGASRGLTNKTETETETKLNRKETETETETESTSGSASVSVSGVSQTQSGSVLPVPGSASRSGAAPVSAQEVLAVWQDYTTAPGTAEDFAKLLREPNLPENPQEYLIAVIRWTFGKSNHWPGKLEDSASFRRAFATVREQHDKYMCKVGAHADRKIEAESKCFEVNDASDFA